MRAGHCVSWMFLLALAASQDDVDSEESRKVLGSSVVTSVSVIMDHGNGTKTYITDAAGQPLTQNEGPVGSPGELLAPDRYEFYTFDESGDLVKRLMTLDQIQGLIAGGDNDAMDTDSSEPMYYHENLPTDSNGHMDVTDMEIPDVQGVRNVVTSVQNVLKGELEATRRRPVANKPLAILNVPDAASSWSILLPAMLGTGDGSMSEEDDSPEMEKINFTEAIKESTTLQTTTTVPSTTTTTEEPSTTIKYVTKRPTDSPTIVHYLPIHNIPTKKPIQIVKTSAKTPLSTTPASSTLPVMEELSASLTSVIAQVANHTVMPVLTTTKAPSLNSTESTNTYLNSPTSPIIVLQNETENSVEYNTSSVSDATVVKTEAQSSNEYTPTNITSASNIVEERIKPPTVVDETLKEFISTTISGSDFSLTPIRVNVSTAKPLEDKFQTKPTAKPVLLNSTADLLTSKDPIISDQHDSSNDKDSTKQPLINKNNVNDPVKVFELINTSTSDILSTLESLIGNTELRNSPSTVKPALQLAVSGDVSLKNALANVTSTFPINKTEPVTSSNNLSHNVTALPEPVKYNTTTFSMDNLEVPLPEMSGSVKEKPLSTSTMKPVKYNTTTLSMDKLEVPLLEMSGSVKEKPLSTSTMKPVKYNTTTLSMDKLEVPLPEMSGSVKEKPSSTCTMKPVKSETAAVDEMTSQKLDDSTKASDSANVKVPATNAPVSTTESTKATNSEIDTVSTTDSTNNSNSLMVSETINSEVKTNSSADANNTEVTKSQNSTYTKPITDVYFTITTYKPATSKPIQVNTKTNNNIEYNIKTSQDEHGNDGTIQPLNLNKSSIDVKLKPSESQQVPESLPTLSSTSTPYVPTTLSLILNSSKQKQTSNTSSTEPDDKKESTITSNTESTTELTVFTTTFTSDMESTDSLSMEDDPSVHESISAVTNILLEDKPHEPPNEPQIPLPTADKEPKPATGELKHASIQAEDDSATTEEMYTTFSATEEPDSTTVLDIYTTEVVDDEVERYNTSSESSNQNLPHENLQASSSSLHSTSENKIDEFNNTENIYEATTDSVTTVEDENLTTVDEGIEITSTESTTTMKIEENVKIEPTVKRPVMPIAPTKESKLNPEQITEGDATNISVKIDDSIIEEHMSPSNLTAENIPADSVTMENITTVNDTFEKITADSLTAQNITQTIESTTPEPILISSSNDKKESTSLPTTENISTVKLDPVTSSKVNTETVTEKIALKSAVKPHDTKTQLLKKPAVQNTFRPLPDPPLTPPSAVELHPAPHESMGLEASTAFLGDDVRRFSDLCNELAFRMWTSITGKGSITSRSLVFSPFSATSLLAMVFLGARGPTSGQMNDILRLDDMVTFNPHQVLQNITESVLNSRNFGVATAAFIRELYSDKLKGKILDFYKERAQQYYDGHVEEIAFNVVGDILRRRTNLLVKRQTLGRIPEYLRGSGLNLRPPLAAFSANIFQTDCEQASIDGRDGEMYFVVRPSTRQRRLVPVPAAVWRTGFLAGYEPGLDATAVSLGTDTVVSTLLILPGQQGQVAPGDGLARLEQRLIETSYRRGGWSRLLRSLLPRPGLELQVPRFSHRSVLNVTGALQRMGLKDLFNEGRADLRGLNGLSNELHLSDMVQVNTFSTCGEEAIGARHHVETYPVSPQRMGRDEPEYYPDFEDEDSIYMSIPLSLRPRQARLPDNPRLRFDRPFLYMVRHNPTGMILYMGRFNPRLLP